MGKGECKRVQELNGYVWINAESADYVYDACRMAQDGAGWRYMIGGCCDCRYHQSGSRRVFLLFLRATDWHRAYASGLFYVRFAHVPQKKRSYIMHTTHYSHSKMLAVMH